jgi:hypothetical protein
MMWQIFEYPMIWRSSVIHQNPGMEQNLVLLNRLRHQLNEPASVATIPHNG